MRASIWVTICILIGTIAVHALARTSRGPTLQEALTEVEIPASVIEPDSGEDRGRIEAFPHER